MTAVLDEAPPIASVRSGQLGSVATEVETWERKIADCIQMHREIDELMTVPAGADVAALIDAEARRAAAEKVTWGLVRDREGHERALEDARRRLAELRERKASLLEDVEACRATIADLEPDAERRAETVATLEKLHREAETSEEATALQAAIRAVSAPADAIQTAKNELMFIDRKLKVLGSE